MGGFVSELDGQRRRGHPDIGDVDIGDDREQSEEDEAEHTNAHSQGRLRVLLSDWTG
jgi:hypothetical protein